MLKFKEFGHMAGEIFKRGCLCVRERRASEQGSNHARHILASIKDTHSIL